MLHYLIVTIGAGLAGMLLFVVSAKGSLAAVVVTYFTPLPIMIAALGWNHKVGLGAALLGVALIALVFHPVLGAIYAAGFALPAWWLAYLALLAKFDARAGTAPEVQREWYPIGRIAAWAAGLTVAAVGLGVLSVSVSDAGFELAARSAAAEIVPLIETIFGGGDRMPRGVSAVDIATMAVRTLPIAAAASLTLLHLVNLWLAGRIVEMSHRLARPWPTLPESFRLPRATAAIVPVAAAMALLLDQYAGLFAAILAAAFAVPLALQGLAVIHALTRKRSARTAIITAVYTTFVLLMPWPLLGFMLLGLVDLLFSLRDRNAAAPSPPRT